MEEANQINVEVSRATAAEEAPGKGSVDGIMEVQEVTESSGPLQPKSLNGLASAYNSAFRHRHGFKEKSKLEQVVIEVSLDSSTDGYLASKQAAEIAGVESVELGGPDRNLLEVIGDGVDDVNLVTLLRKKFGNAKLISTGPVKEPMKDIMEDEPVLIKEEENEPELQPPVSPSIPHCLHPISESAVDTEETEKLNGGTEMETKKNTHSNLGLENAESSCKSSAVDTEETKKLNGGMEMETKKNTHSNLGLENAESSCKSSAVDTVETEKLNGAMLGSPQDAMKGAMEDDPDLIKEDEKQKLLQRSVSPSTPSSESAVDTEETEKFEWRNGDGNQEKTRIVISMRKMSRVHVKALQWIP
ncbi:hypothetical protein OIU85_012922 [Salix viminalis]|uniref:Uncharacterized protein n=1 Tax=Salix viminalis TaxID=40686 RepID=A0A9Q0NQ98_SALVM|nr:hypothetical protein OIU85_012922 [Salix viminalis]